jgi:hypothetical protein
VNRSALVAQTRGHQKGDASRDAECITLLLTTRAPIARCSLGSRAQEPGLLHRLSSKSKCKYWLWLLVKLYCSRLPLKVCCLEYRSDDDEIESKVRMTSQNHVRHGPTLMSLPCKARSTCPRANVASCTVVASQFARIVCVQGRTCLPQVIIIISTNTRDSD